jgi:hypothetical protein
VFREAYERHQLVGLLAPLEQARSTEFEIAISRFDTFRPSQAVLRFVRVYNLRRAGRASPEIRAFRALVTGLQVPALSISWAK